MSLANQGVPGKANVHSWYYWVVVVEGVLLESKVCPSFG